MRSFSKLIPFFTLFVIFIPLITFAQWSQDVKLTTTEIAPNLNENMGRCLAASGDTVHVVWCDNISNGSAIYYKHSYDGGLTWSTDTRISGSPSNADFPAMAISGKTVHIVFRDSTSGQKTSYYRRSIDGGNTWGAIVSLGNYYWWPSIAVSGSCVFVALNSNSTGNSEVWCRRSVDNGTTWDTVSRISNASGRSEDPSIAAGSGYVHIVWNDNRTGIMQTFYRKSADNGLTWGPEIQLTHSTVFAYCPLICTFGSNVDLVWADRRSGDYDIYYMHSADYGSNWGAEKQLTSDILTSVYPVIDRDEQNIHIVWWNFSSDISYLHSGNGGSSWDSTVSLVQASSNPSNPFVSIAGPLVHVIWVDKRLSHQSIYYKRNPTGNLIPEITVDPDSLAFGNVKKDSIAAMTYTLKGYHLTNDIQINAPLGFSVKAGTGNYAQSISVTKTSDSVSETIHVRFIPIQVKTYLDSINNSSNTANEWVKVNGTVINSTGLNSNKSKDIQASVYPNPFTAKTIISYKIATAGYIKITVYSHTGELLQGLINEYKNPGGYKTEFDGAKFPAGIYLYKVENGKSILTGTMIKEN